MGITKIFGLILIVLSLPLLLGGFILLYAPAEPPEESIVPLVGDSDGRVSGYIYGASGVGALLIGVILIFVERSMRFHAEERTHEPTHVEIKRTDMNVGAPAPESVGDDLQSQIDDVSRKLARLKIQLAMGEVSADSFRILKERLDKEKGDLEIQRLDQGGG